MRELRAELALGEAVAPLERSSAPAGFLRREGRAGLREPVAVSVAFLLLCALFLALAPYGLELSDEGYILYPAYQVAHGAVPYRDIVSLYTPLTWYLNGALFRLFGVDLLPIRFVFAVAKVCFILLTYVLARRLMPPLFAAIPGLLLVLLDPAPRHWAPYPAYYGLAGSLAALLAMSRFMAQRHGGWLVAAGLLVAFVFAAKPSIGLFTLLALTAFLLYSLQDLAPPTPEAPGGWAAVAIETLRWGCFAGTLLVCTLVLHQHLSLALALEFLLPVAVAWMVNLAWPASAGGSPAALGWLVRHLALLWGGFLAATLPWLAALAATVGLPLTVQWVFLSGVGTADAFFAPLLWPNSDAVEGVLWALAGAAVAAGISFLAGRGVVRFSHRGLALAGAALLAAAAGLLWYRARSLGLSPLDYLVTNLQGRLWRQTVEENDLVVYLPFIGFWLLMGWLLWWSRRSVSGVQVWHGRLLALFGALFLLQLYPKVSNQHALFTVAPFLLPIAFTLSRVFAWSVRQWPDHRPPWLARGALVACLLVLPLSFVPPSVRMKVSVVREAAAEPSTPLPWLRLSYTVARPLDQVTEYVQRRTRPGEPIFIYPASPIFYLTTRRPNPTRYSYLPSGYIDRTGQEEIMTDLARAGVRYIIWDQALVDRWGLRPSDQPLVEYLWTRYRPVQSIDTYMILERVDEHA